MPRKSLKNQGIVVFSTPSDMSHRIVDKWGDYRVIGANEAGSFSIKDRDAKTNTSRAEGKNLEREQLKRLVASSQDYR